MVVDRIVLVIAVFEELAELNGLISLVVVEGFLVESGETEPQSEEADEYGRNRKPATRNTAGTFAASPRLAVPLRIAVCHRYKTAPGRTGASQGRERFRNYGLLLAKDFDFNVVVHGVGAVAGSV